MEFVFTDSSVIDRLDSMSKYPSIPTYHDLGERGILVDEQVQDISDELLYVHEKIDGTNTRIVIVPNGAGFDYFIGSRDNLLYAKGDRVVNPTLGIVNNVKPIAEKLTELSMDRFFGENTIPAKNSSPVVIIFGETYGHKVGSKWKAYGNEGNVGFRMFDIAFIDDGVWQTVLSKEKEQISTWREHGGYNWVPTENLIGLSHVMGIDYVPHVFNMDSSSELPTSIEKVYDWLKFLGEDTLAGLGGDVGKREGLIVRNSSRSSIVKIRFEDYERTLRKMNK